MKTTQITIQGAAGGATLTRVGNKILIEPNGLGKSRMLDANSSETERWAAASWLSFRLEGIHVTHSDCRDYLRVIESLAD